MKQLIKKWYWNNLCYKKLLIIVLFLLANIFTSKAQVNLLQNPSFEDTIQILVDTWGQECVKNWHNLDSTRPYNCGFFLFTEYSYLNAQFKLPNSAFVYTEPRNGASILGSTIFWKYYFLPPPNSVRALPTSRLKSKLFGNKKYCAKAWVTPSEYQGYYTNGFGMYFDNGQLDTIVAKDSSGIYPFVIPQVQAPNIINDTAGWTLVSGTFVATGLETHVHLGNWLSDSATLKQPNNLQICECEDIFIDDVSLIPVDIANWLHDTSVTLTDSVYIGLPKYEVPDAVWYTYNMLPIDTASGIWVKPTQSVTKYIQAIDVCDKVAFDTVTVYAYPLSNANIVKNGLQLQVYPNPAKHFVHVNNATANQVQLINMYGQIMQTSIVYNFEAYLQTASLPRGIYFIKCNAQVVKAVLE
jgi:hypothetical protein